MAEIIRMPRMSDTMTEGVIVAWHKQVGDTVKSGDLMAEVETDKATMELESYNNGTILYIGIPAGQSVPVDGVLAVIGKPGEEYQNLLNSSANNEIPATITDSKVANESTNPNATTIATTNTSTSAEKFAEGEKTTTAPAHTAIDITNLKEVVLMPRMSDTMTEGVIAEWHKQVGDTIKIGDLLAEVETDKATMELESYVGGTLLHIGVPKGGKVPVNALLAIIGDGTKVDLTAIITAANNSGAVADATTIVVPEVKAENESTSAEKAAKGKTEHTTTDTAHIKASPLAKALAKEKGLNLQQLKGSGDGGRIIKKDIDNYTPQPENITAKAAITTAAALATTALVAKAAKPTTTNTSSVAPFVPNTTAAEGYTDVQNSQMRKTIAKRLSESKFTAPHFYLKMEINMDNAIAARKALNEVSPVKISFQDLMIKACASALRQNPAVNSSWMGDYIRTYHHIHIGSAVAVEDGLIVPVFKHADQKSLSQIATEANDLYTKAKTKKLQPAEFTGNTFTISNLGMMDIDEFTAIVNPPDSAILAVGKIKEVVVKTAEGFGVANMLTLTLSCDHRIVDGAVGARFLQSLKAYLQNPVTMLV